ncbi:beta-propeller fold lactonase family protein [Streptomyces sp. NBC_01217]|uniref:beta-propeller fold lactonase family protein n=1 Tax=Streptomyces sp. NBC_01217 TaxID=2903779 RepID=UPI002E0D9800
MLLLLLTTWTASSGTHPSQYQSVQINGGTSPSAPVVSHDGSHLWAVVRGTDTIAVPALDAVGEQADLIASVPCGGSGAA